MHYPSHENHFLTEHTKLIAQSFYTLLGRKIMSDEKNLGKELFQAKFALLSHTNEIDPVFNYANLVALSLFEYSWEEIIQLPSRLSTEPINQTQRIQTLEQVTHRGFIDNYQGIRISKTGKRFMIHNAIVWNLFDERESYKGQAACFSDWEYV